MFNFYKQENGKIKQTQFYSKNCWINVTDPSTEEIEKLKKDYLVPEEFIEDILDIDERARTEISGRWLMIVLRVPVYVANNDFSFFTVPLGVLISANSVITLCDRENEIINDIIEGKIKGFDIENRHNFILYLFQLSATYYLRFMKIIVRRTNQIEKDIRKSIENSQLNMLLVIQKTLVYFMTSLKSNEMLLAKLQRAKYVDNEQLDEELLEDVVIENKQAFETATIHSEILTGMMDAFASVISNNLNLVMKRLTIITICVMIPSIFSGLFGMNVPNSSEANPYTFWFVIGASITIPALVVLTFKRLRWL
ncbi:MAG: magnesium transporter CorA family protein [Bacteroidota bacterium]